jgi:DNA polymerase
MGGTGIAIDEREAASALRWWLEMGVDAAIQESPRNWLERGQAPAPAESPQPPAPAPVPESLEAFREWLASSPDAPLASARSKPVLPVGAEGAEIMLLSDPPTSDEIASGAPIGGEAAELMERILAAIGLSGQAYSANLACFHSPGGRLGPRELEACAAAARRHVALARPKRLLLLGDAPCRALLGKGLVDARGHVHRIEGVRAVATCHPRFLLTQPSKKADCWKDLLLMMEEAP